MRWFICITLLACIFAGSVFAQLKTGNKYVTAIIDPNNQGLITVRLSPATNLDPILSYPQKTFVTIKLGDKIFTNNHTGQHITDDPRFGGFLDNGLSQKVADTIRTTWANKNGCDIIQEVYPVLLEASGQIVMRWKVRNYSAAEVYSAAQLLLDLQVGGQNPNDGAPLLTKYGYRPIWEKYTPGTGAYGIPWFFASFENNLPNPPAFDPGITSVGYTQDVNYKLSLKPPSLMAIGDWGSPLGVAAFVDFLWGVSASAPWGSGYTDAAMLLQWDDTKILGGKTVELGRTSYGTGEFGVCAGQLFGIVFYPRHFEWKSSKYIPDTANVEFYAYDVYSPLPQDPNYGPPSTDTYLKLHVGPNLRIISPDTARSSNQRIQRQQTSPNGNIPQYGVGIATWKIVADKVINCKDDLNSWLKFTAESSLSGTGPIFHSSGDADTCEHLVVIDCSLVDTLPPAVEALDTSAAFTKSFAVRDNRIHDRGISSITWTASVKSGDIFNINKFSITTTPELVPCSKDTHRIQIAQLDSTAGACFEYTIKDCANNDTTITLCFQSHTYVPIPDTIIPVIKLDSSEKAHLVMVINDSTTYDSGVDSTWIVPGIATDTAKFFIVRIADDGPCLKGDVFYVITQLDTNVGGCFTVHAIDCAGNGNSSSEYCFPASTSDVSTHSVDAETCELIGNPASERTTLFINSLKSQAAVIRVVDMSGREVAVQRAMLSVGTNEIPIVTESFAEGTYYVIAEWDGKQYAKKLQVIQ
jgi:hypothetical protein